MKKINIDDYEGMRMEDFLYNYVGLDIMKSYDKVKILSRATHRDIKELGIYFLKTVPFDSVTEEDIATGRILIVADGKSSVRNKRNAPYIRPEILIEEHRQKEMELNKEDILIRERRI
jgi:hypothetical protein